MVGKLVKRLACAWAVLGLIGASYCLGEVCQGPGCVVIDTNMRWISETTYSLNRCFRFSATHAHSNLTYASIVDGGQRTESGRVDIFWCSPAKPNYKDAMGNDQWPHETFPFDPPTEPEECFGTGDVPRYLCGPFKY